MLYMLLFTTLLCCNCDDMRSGSGSRFDEIEIRNPNDDSEQPSISEEWIETAGITELMQTKADAYRTNSGSEDDGLRNGVYVYSSTVAKYESNPRQLAARIAVLGFRDVYLSPGKSKITSADSWLRTFISALSEYGLKAYAVRIADNAILIDESMIDDEVELIKTYNAKVNANERFAGISADLEPHTAKGSSHPGSELPYTWDSSTNYGVGKDNDQLLRITLERLTKAGNALHPDLGLNEAIFYNYQIYFDRGELSYGSVPQFLNCCDWVIVMAYLNQKESIWEKSEPSLQAAGTEKSVSICIKTAVNSSDSSSIQDQGWNYLLETVKYLREQAADYDAFRGVDIFTYEGLETMWEWLNDKN